MTVESVFERISGFLTDEALVRALIITFAFCLGCFVLAALFRLIFGKRSTAVAAVTITLDILVLYMAVVLLPLYVPNIDRYLPTLPFSSIGAGYIEFMVIPQLGRDLLAAQIIAVDDAMLAKKLDKQRADAAAKVLEKDAAINKQYM